MLAAVGSLDPDFAHIPGEKICSLSQRDQRAGLSVERGNEKRMPRAPAVHSYLLALLASPSLSLRVDEPIVTAGIQRDLIDQHSVR
jgi:hypothetical protein